MKNASLDFSIESNVLLPIAADDCTVFAAVFFATETFLDTVLRAFFTFAVDFLTAVFAFAVALRAGDFFAAGFLAAGAEIADFTTGAATGTAAGTADAAAVAGNELVGS
ncbi:MAG: hypothetical protein LRY76_08740 [Alphaproteobacteria bacterium]|nr:hypothetical protein [Alphaproteobacteria bacterium]MCD8571579.1 hypothetical protein [Alphaproteobacteria bacterium]